MSKINWKDNFQFSNFKFLIFTILSLLLIYTRFVNLSWGLPYPMHPDERNMAAAIQQLNFADKFNPHFFAYGQFPLYLGYGLGILGRLGRLGREISFNEAIFLLRIISASASVITAFVIMGILGRLGLLGRLGKKSFVLNVSCFIILIFSPVLIQFAHFGTTESLLMLFYSIIIYGSLLYIQKKLTTTNYLLLTSLIIGFAIATKISSIIFLALPIYVFFTCASRSYNRLIAVGKLVLLTIAFSILFAPHNLISFGEFTSSMYYESAVALGQVNVFYTRQFDTTIPIIFQIVSIFPYALGLPVFVLGGLGLLGRLGKGREISLLRFAFILVFLPNAFMYAKWTRFMAPVFPVLIIFATLIINQIKAIKIIKIIIIILAILPGLAYLSVYRNPDVRFQASEWIYKNISKNAYILSETANVIDIPLTNKYYNDHKGYRVVSFNFYDLDQEKDLRQELSYYIKNSDYIIVPSRRIFKNHSKEKYPLLSEYYKRLFSGKLGFKQVAEFSSYPKISLFDKTLFEIPDENAEETWTVFDHPVIRVYKRI